MTCKTTAMPPPRDAAGTQSLPARSQPGYYPGFSTMAQKDHWDKATHDKIITRVETGYKALAFFTPAEAEIMQCLLDCALPQPDRGSEHRIPLLQAIDQRLSSKTFEGYIYEGCPEDDVAHRKGISAVEAMAQEYYRQSFISLPVTEQETLLMSIKDGKPLGGMHHWDGLPPAFYWNLLVQDAVSAYYAHPFAWDEIGFGGPAYPRGYMRLTEGKPEPWEKDEVRYEWLAPQESRSDKITVNENLFPPSYVHDEKGK